MLSGTTIGDLFGVPTATARTSAADRGAGALPLAEDVEQSATCGPGTHNLLDLFQVAINPLNGKTAIMYTDDTLTTSSDPTNFACLPGQTPPCPLPQAVLVQ